MSTSISRASKASTLARVQALIAGTQKQFPKGQLSFGGTTYTPAAIVKLLTQLLNAITSLNAAQASAKKSLLAKQGVAAQVGPFITAYQRFVLSTFGNDPETLADFGLEPPKAPKPLSGEDRVAATAKADATRKARGTTGKKEKLAIQGNVTGVTVTPVTSSADAPPPPQPASSASTAIPSGTASK
jgi:hypothetical protein